MSHNVSFTTFYSDPSLTGHVFLKPSISVGKGYQRIFSSITQKNAFIEVILRIALFCLLPVAALFASLLIPIGLAVKGLSYVFSAKPQPTERDNPPTDVESQQIPAIEPVIAANSQAIDEELNSIEQEINTIDIKHIDIGLVDRLLERLNASIFEDIEIHKESETTHPLQAEIDRWQILQGRLSNFRHHHDFYPHISFDTTHVQGEIPVDDNGDCLFLSFQKSYQLNGHQITDNVQEIREEVVKWMQEKWVIKTEFQRHFISSLAEHYLAKAERLEGELTNLQSLLTEAKAEAEQLTNVSESESYEPYNNPEIGLQLKIYELSLNISHAEEKIVNISSNISTIMHAREAINYGQSTRELLDDEMPQDYFDEMSQAGKHGGHGELYALSEIYNVCLKIYTKRTDTNGQVFADQQNVQIIGEQSNPSLDLIHSHNHYNAYAPPVDSGIDHA